MSTMKFTLIVLVLSVANVQSMPSVEHLKAKVVEVSDTYAVIDLIGSADYPYGKLNVIGSMDKGEDKHIWVPADEDFEFKITKGKNTNDTQSVSHLMRITNLKPNQLYRFTIEGKNGNVTYTATYPEDVTIRTKALRPKAEIKKAISLQLEGRYVRHYFVRVEKFWKNQNVREIVINTKVSADHTNTVTLDNLNPGTKYLIKYWYENKENKISPMQSIEYQA